MACWPYRRGIPTFEFCQKGAMPAAPHRTAPVNEVHGVKSFWRPQEDPSKSSMRLKRLPGVLPGLVDPNVWQDPKI